MDSSRIRYLFTQYEEGKATETELSELFAFFEERNDLEAVSEFFIRELEESDSRETLDRQIWMPVVEQILAQKRAPVISLSRLRRSAVWAAVVILLLGIGSWWLLYHRTKQGLKITAAEIHNDVAAPSVARAVITLAGGNKLYLDSTIKGAIAIQGNTQIVKQANDKITYQADVKERSAAIQYNTLDNPRGSRVVNITLADGSKVWLNAGSSLTYPVAFTGSERRVEISGEAYFEIAHNASMPFKVKKGTTEITVLGTHFNVNAYDDEPAIKITLLEGKVKVSTKYEVRSTKYEEAMLRPGEQAAVFSHSPLTIDHSPDLDEAIAWKNGLFQFRNSDVETVMKQVARWYDVDIVYEGGKSSKHFGGKISRDVNVSEMLRVIAVSGIHFRIENKRITVMP